MKNALMTATVLAGLLLTVGATDPVSVIGAGNRVASAAAAGSVSDGLQQKGRFKKEGDNCVWNAEDSGPNQCAPVTRGRFKKGGDDSCAWDANDNGPDQCTPRTGRWKKGDDRCYWDAKDSGPN